MILDGVVCSSWEHFGHFGPLVAVGGVCQKQDPLLVRHPFDLEDTRVEVIVPSFSALLAEASLDELGNKRPPLRSILFDQSSDQVILGLGPGLLSKEFVPCVIAISA